MTSSVAARDAVLIVQVTFRPVVYIKVETADPTAGVAPLQPSALLAGFKARLNSAASLVQQTAAAAVVSGRLNRACVAASRRLGADAALANSLSFGTGVEVVAPPPPS